MSSSTTTSPAPFDLAGVQAQVEGVLAASGVEEARKLWEETLSAWADEYSRLLEEADPPLATPAARQPYENGLVDLWLEYANFERHLRQWKQAVKVFESATTDVIGEKAPRLWVEYGRFCRERGKFANAQKVYLRAVEVLATKAERDVIWAEFLEALKAKPGAEGIETVGQLKAMLGVAEEEAAEEEEDKAHVPAPEAPTTAAPMDVDEAVPTDEAPTTLPAAPPPVATPTMPPAPSQMEQQPAAAAPGELGPPLLLFTTTEPLSMDNAYGTGLGEATLAAVKALLTDPDVLQVVEGQWLVQAMKQQLAGSIVAQVEAKHAEAAQRLALRQAQVQAANPGPALQEQLEGERRELAAACERERGQVRQQLATELWQLLESQQAVLGENGVGLPEVRVTRDRATVETQQKVVRLVTANVQLFHFHQKRDKLVAQVTQHQELLKQLQQQQQQQQGSPTTSSGSVGGSGSHARDGGGGGGGSGGEGGGRKGAAASATTSSTRATKAGTRSGSGTGRGGQGSSRNSSDTATGNNKRGAARSSPPPPRRSSRRGGGGGGGSNEEPNPPPSEDNRAILRKMMQHFK